MKTLLAGLGIGLLLVLPSDSPAEDWPGWRGSSGQGISTEKDLPLHWGGKERRNIRWQALLPGQNDKAKQDQNQSSPIVSRGRVFVTASYWPAGVEPKQFPEHHVVCFRARDGEKLWDTRIEHGPWSRAATCAAGTRRRRRPATANRCTSFSARPSWPRSTSRANHGGAGRSRRTSSTWPSAPVRCCTATRSSCSAIRLISRRAWWPSIARRVSGNGSRNGPTSTSATARRCWPR